MSKDNLTKLSINNAQSATSLKGGIVAQHSVMKKMELKLRNSVFNMLRPSSVTDYPKA